MKANLPRMAARTSSNIGTDAYFQHVPLQDPGRTIRLFRLCHKGYYQSGEDCEGQANCQESETVIEISHYALPGIDDHKRDESVGADASFDEDDRVALALAGIDGPSSQELVRFTAVSYCWGSQASTPRIITVNQKSFLVSENLCQLLLALIQSDTASDGPGVLDGRLFWIDQLCINQHDTRERSIQVGLMCFLYPSAEAVYAWLGLEYRSTVLALDTLEFYHFGRSGLGLDEERWRRAFGLEKYDDQTSEIARNPLASLLPRMLSLLEIHLIILRCRSMDTAGCLPSFEAVAMHGWRFCQDPLDKVFSLEGLVKSEYRTTVDYTQSSPLGALCIWVSQCASRKRDLLQDPVDRELLLETVRALYPEMRLGDLGSEAAAALIDDPMKFRSTRE